MSARTADDVRSPAAERASRREVFWLRLLSILFVVAAGLSLVLMGPETRQVLAPVAAMIALALLYLCVLSAWERHLPLFEVATFFVLATTVYSIVPLIQYTMAGFTFGLVSDNRLVQLQPAPHEFGAFAWRHVVLLAAYVLTYIAARGRRLWPLRSVSHPPAVVILVIVVIASVLSGLLFGLQRYVGSSSVYEGGSGNEYFQLPLVVLQLANVSLSVVLTLKQCLVIILLMRWNRRSSRVVLVVWLLAETAVTIAMGQSRTSAVLLLLTAVVGYHRVVKPLRVKSALVIGASLLGFVLIYGLLRDFGPGRIRVNTTAAMNASNEFQVLYANAYDLHYRRVNGLLPPIPPQMFFVDFYRLIPSQLLPFYKWDPSEWYLEVLELRGRGVGLMFGVIAQGVIGYDWIELLCRGALLALLHGFAHRAYRRYSASFWATIIYLFILSWVYFAFRSTSFDIFYRLVYYLAPTLLIVRMFTVLLSRVTGRNSRRAVPASVSGT